MQTLVSRHCREAALSFATKWRSSFGAQRRPSLRRAAALVIAALALGAAAPNASAAPAAFAYQGVIREADGTVPGNKNQTIQFRLYTQAEGGTPVWGRTVAVLLDADGLFNTELSDSAGSAIPDVTGTGLASILSAKAKQTLSDSPSGTRVAKSPRARRFCPFPTRWSRPTWRPRAATWMSRGSSPPPRRRQPACLRPPRSPSPATPPWPAT